MRYFELPVYRKALELSGQIHESTKKMPADFRISYVVPMKIQCAEIAEDIAFADDDMTSRVRFIVKALGTLHSVEIKVRWLYDMHFIPKKGFCVIMRIEAELAKQLFGWKNSSENKQLQKTGVDEPVPANP